MSSTRPLDIVVYGSVTIFDLLMVTLILIIAVIIAKGVALNLRRALRDKVSKEHLEILAKTIYYSIIVIAVLSVLPTSGYTPQVCWLWGA